MFRRLAALAALLTLAFAGCGARHPTAQLPPSVVNACPQATGGHGAMGACAPAGFSIAPLTAVGGITYPDLSNNDPTYDMRAIRAHGHPGAVLKANQGTAFVDSTFVPMARAAKAAGLCVGGYDFDERYTAAEAYLFVARLHAAGIYRNTRCTFAPTLDVEFGEFNAAGLSHQIAVLEREYGRVKIYTGDWYIEPHLGCAWPAGVPGWISGYPNASRPCGLPERLFVEHQYTDSGFNGATTGDMTIYRGSQGSFAAFVHKGKPGPTPAQIRAAKSRSLHAHEADRRVLHGLIDKHHCRKGQHVTPSEPLHTRRHLHNELCPRWIAHGKTDVATIDRYRKEGIR